MNGKLRLISQSTQKAACAFFCSDTPDGTEPDINLTSNYCFCFWHKHLSQQTIQTLLILYYCFASVSAVCLSFFSSSLLTTYPRKHFLTRQYEICMQPDNWQKPCTQKRVCTWSGVIHSHSLLMLPAVLSRGARVMSSEERGKSTTEPALRKTQLLKQPVPPTTHKAGDERRSGADTETYGWQARAWETPPAQDAHASRVRGFFHSPSFVRAHAEKATKLDYLHRSKREHELSMLRYLMATAVDLKAAT